MIAIAILSANTMNAQMRTPTYVSVSEDPEAHGTTLSFGIEGEGFYNSDLEHTDPNSPFRPGVPVAPAQGMVSEQTSPRPPISGDMGLNVTLCTEKTFHILSYRVFDHYVRLENAYVLFSGRKALGKFCEPDSGQRHGRK